MGELEKSDKYFKKVFELNPGYYDYVNYGHLKWAMGDRKAAINNYLQSLQDKNLTFSEFQKTMADDRKLLLKNGIDTEEIPLMMDYLRYNKGV